jgi:ATP-binding protein involved in chromosome partitioning
MSTCESRQCPQGGAKHHHQAGEDESRLEEQLGHIRHKLLVMSSKGGVGKTSVAVYLALSLAWRGHQVGLLDVELHGPDVPRMLGISGRFGMDDEGHLVPHQYDDHLQAAGMQVILGVEGQVREAVENYRAGKLKPARGPNVTSHRG